MAHSIAGAKIGRVAAGYNAIVDGVLMTANGQQYAGPVSFTPR